MDYEKKYKEALERAKQLLRTSVAFDKFTIERVFLELKENKKEWIEKVRQELKSYLEHREIKQISESDAIQQWITWLEKDEQKPANKAKVKHLIPQKGIYYTCIKDYYSSDNTHLCVKGNIYKSFFNGYIDDESHLGLSWTNSCAEKYFEPTKDEDWIVCEHDNVIGKPMQYKEFKKKVNQKFIENLKAQGLTPKLRLWNLKDAKDGNVLYSSGFHSACIFIFNRLDIWRFDEPNGERAVATGYCCLTLSADTMDFGIQGPDCIEVNTIKPATKEQCNLLFQKMKEAGYIFDFKNKELKKIETEIEIPFGAKDSELQEATYFIPKGFHAEIDDDKVVIKKGEKPVEWSEDDEHRVKDTIYFLDTAKKHYASTVELDACIDWLKFIKQRIGG